MSILLRAPCYCVDFTSLRISRPCTREIYGWCGWLQPMDVQKEVLCSKGSEIDSKLIESITQSTQLSLISSESHSFSAILLSLSSNSLIFCSATKYPYISLIFCSATKYPYISLIFAINCHNLTQNCPHAHSKAKFKVESSDYPARWLLY